MKHGYQAVKGLREAVPQHALLISLPSKGPSLALHQATYELNHTADACTTTGQHDGAQLVMLT